MKNLTKILIVMPVLLALLLAGCAIEDPTDPTEEVNPPTVDDASSRYAAIGNSLTAGYMDGGVTQAGQINSYPRLIANQLGLDNTEFTQPWIAAPGIGSSTPSSAAMVAGVLHWTGTGIGVVGETAMADLQSTLLLAGTQPTPYHNLGVPGALLHDGMQAYDSASSVSGSNPFFTFINRASFFGNNELSTMLPDGVGGAYEYTYQSDSMGYASITKGGALTTIWLGNNDILGAASSGNPNNPVPITDAGAFQAEYTSMLMTIAGGLLQVNGFPATIITATIPSITSAPYFMPESLFDFVVQDQIDVSWPGGYEESDVEIVLFTALSWINTPGLSPATPIPSEYTLTSSEVTAINTAVATFNGIIQAVTTAVNASGAAVCGVMDANALLAGLSDTQKSHFMLILPQVGNDVATAASMTAFSLDGIHPNNVGYGIVANAFIEVANTLDGTSIPAVDLAELAWDPTYGVVPEPDKAGTTIMSPQAADAMTNLFR